MMDLSEHIKTFEALKKERPEMAEFLDRVMERAMNVSNIIDRTLYLADRHNLHAEATAGFQRALDALKAAGYIPDD